MGMWLVIGLLLVLAAAAVLASLWKEHDETTNEIQLPPVLRPRRSAGEFSVLTLSDAFEPELAPIWEPQIEMLRLIREAGPPGLDYELLRPAQLRLAQKYPELYEGSDLESWLEAMEQAELIEWSDSTVKLTAAGLAFLKCRLVVTV